MSTSFETSRRLFQGSDPDFVIVELVSLIGHSGLNGRFGSKRVVTTWAGSRSAIAYGMVA